MLLVHEYRRCLWAMIGMELGLIEQGPDYGNLITSFKT